MRKISAIVVGAFLMLGASFLSASEQNLQIFSTNNAKSSIDAKSVQKAFDESGVVVDVNPFLHILYAMSSLLVK